MSALEQLVESLLYEGYALYPYTPDSTKNATPTPFGILYPPRYAVGSGATFDHLRLECRLAEPGPLSAELRFLQATGDGHRAVERRVEVERPGLRRFAFGGVRGRVRLRVDGDCVRVYVRNESDVRAGLSRAEALRSSLLSTHVLVRSAGGRFQPPLESGCRSVNTYPVLATPEDDVVLGAAIVLPDHPRLAERSRGSLFDATEIEEALLLHVRTLSDGERAAIAAGDPEVAAMVERALAAGRDDIVRLHGALEPVGEDEAVVGGVTVRPGAKVVLRPRGGADAQDFLLDGRTATLERIYVDVDDGLHLAVTVDGDPMQEVLRESGRFLFFKPDEVEVSP